MPLPTQLPDILSMADLYLTPLYIFLFFVIVRLLKRKYYVNSPFRKFILPAFWIHVVACILFACIMQFYYGWGDVFGYYTGAHEIWEAFRKNPAVALELIFSSRENYSQAAIAMAPYGSFPGFAYTSSTVIKMAGFISLFCFGTYIPIALVFTMFSFWGTWLIFLTIYRYFPRAYKLTGLAILFVPSVIIWSSGISKEPPCMFALGLAFYSFDKILNSKRFIRHATYLVVGCWMLLSLKNYIFYTFAFAACAWTYQCFIGGISNNFLRLLIKCLVVAFVLGVMIYFYFVPGNALRESILTGFAKGENLQELMSVANERYGNTGYTLPAVNYTPWGFISSFFSSLNVTLFRPYIWETENVLMLMSVAESLATSLLAIYAVFKGGLFRLPALLKRCPVIAFMTVFTLVFAPIVGFISFNFGTLVRYKIPCLPFFLALLVLMILQKRNSGQQAPESEITSSASTTSGTSG